MMNRHSLQRFLLRSLILPILLSGTCLNAQTEKPSAPVYLDSSKPVAERVNDLIGRMTLEEKVTQLTNVSRAIPRLQVPEYNWWSEALHGVARNGIATVFPEPIGLAATFDAPLVQEMAAAIGVEARVKHNQALRAGRRGIYTGLDFWSPNVNIFRDPRWGRGQETYGEDPFLTGKMGVAFVTGLQGDDAKYYRAISTPKHFAVHSGPESVRHSQDVKVSKHDMEDTYLPAFRASVVEGRAGSVMCAYNRINGQPACANDFLLRDQLRGAWKFQGYVVSDCGAVEDIADGHAFTRSMAAAGAAAIKAGMDNECADYRTPLVGDSDYVKYLDAVKQGLLSEKELDNTLRRLYTGRFRLGLFDPPEMVRYAQTPDSELDSAAHRELALQAANRSMVLLKNDGVLPLKSGIKKIVVTGPLAESTRVLEGNYSGTPSRATNALEGIRKALPQAEVTYVPGTNFLRAETPVPFSVLTTPEGHLGIKAEYFTGEVSGQPQAVRVEKSVDLELEGTAAGSVTPPEGMRNFTARWTGFLTPAESGRYRLGISGSMFRMWLDGKLIVDDNSIHDRSATMSEVALQAGHAYPLKIEFRSIGFASKLVWLKLIDDVVEQAAAAAKQADVVVAVVGLTSQLEGEEMKVDLPGFSGGDRTSLDLPKDEEELLHGLRATGTPLVVVLMNGSALSVNWAAERANAILEAWYPGEEGGTAVGQTLTGASNPAGRLPVTFYRGVEQLPAFEDYSMRNRTYRYFPGEPLYPFGYGLSYTTFVYSNLRLSAQELKAGDALTVDVDVKNTGAVAGDEVVQLYLGFPKVPGAPLRALRGFSRVKIAAGETRPVRFSLHARDLSSVDEAGDRVVAAGAYTVSVGGGQPGGRTAVSQAALAIVGSEKLPE
jgi:beta-glucosidase